MNRAAIPTFVIALLGATLAAAGDRPPRPGVVRPVPVQQAMRPAAPRLRISIPPPPLQPMADLHMTSITPPPPMPATAVPPVSQPARISSAASVINSPEWQAHLEQLRREECLRQAAAHNGSAGMTSAATPFYYRGCVDRNPALIAVGSSVEATMRIGAGALIQKGLPTPVANVLTRR